MNSYPYTFERTDNTHARTRTHARTFIGKIEWQLSNILDTTLSIILYTGCVYYPGHTLSNKLGTFLVANMRVYISDKGIFLLLFSAPFLPIARAIFREPIEK